MPSNSRANELLGLLLKKRMEIVQRVEKRAEFGEPCDRKHREILALCEEARVYAAELAGIVGKDEAQEQWELLGRVAYGLDLICRKEDVCLTYELLPPNIGVHCLGSSK